MVKITLFSAVATLAVGAMAATEDVTTDMFIVGYSSVPLVASVITSDSTATTFSITCATAKDCQYPTNFLFTQGPSTIHYTTTHSPTASSDYTGIMDVGCTITASDHGVCTKTIEATLGTITSGTTSATVSFTSGGSELGGQVVTITAGHLVVPTTSATTTSSHAKSTSKSSTQDEVVVMSTDTVSPVPQSTASPSSSTTNSAFFEATATAAIGTSSSSAGAMPMITAHAQWVIGGAAAMAALAVL